MLAVEYATDIFKKLVLLLYESHFQMIGETKEATMLEKQISPNFLKRLTSTKSKSDPNPK